ncbi:hypothetical protein QUF70_00340 [Desulfobacterales bacterium HSG17]|nr:hypothetical protein [Desulfobacterales bacterium HSG17]
MTRQWYEPLNFSEWLKRAFSFLNIAVFILTATFLVSELRFDWFENIVGSYLASTNTSRPKTGVIWETGKHTSTAHEYLNRIINQKEDTQASVHEASSFSNLVSDMLPGDWVTLEKDHFKTLYLTLDKSMAGKIVEPAQLVWLLKGSMLDRIFCEGIPGGIKIYFIDSENRVIKQIDLEKQDILEIEKGEQAVKGELSAMEGFFGRIYPAETFFDAVFKLPADILPDLMVNPEILLAQNGKITNVGIWNITQNSYIKLGFEFEEQGRKKVVFVKGREWAVWQLSLYLKGDEN